LGLEKESIAWLLGWQRRGLVPCSAITDLFTISLFYLERESEALLQCNPLLQDDDCSPGKVFVVKIPDDLCLERRPSKNLLSCLLWSLLSFSSIWVVSFALMPSLGSRKRRRRTLKNTPRLSLRLPRDLFYWRCWTWHDFLFSFLPLEVCSFCFLSLWIFGYSKDSQSVSYKISIESLHLDISFLSREQEVCRVIHSNI
jgi:hypothetical protein